MSSGGSMGSRRNRLNLSLVRKCDSPKSPVHQAQSTKIDSSMNTSLACNSPLSSRKDYTIQNDGSPILFDNDSLAIPMSQDTSNLLSGVSWAWNSPKRAIANASKQRPRPLLLSNVLSNRDSKYKAQRKKSEELTGFYKFQSELKLLQQSTETSTGENQCSKTKTDSETSIPSSPDCENMFISFSIPTDVKTSPVQSGGTKTTHQKNQESHLSQSDSFNDSYFDNLLLQASQVIENKSQNNATVPPETSNTRNVTEKLPGKRRSLVKSLTSDNLSSIQDDLFNDSDLDGFLIEASQMIEQKVMEVNAAPKTPNSSSRRTVLFTRHKSMPESPRPNIVPNSIRNHIPDYTTKQVMEQPVSAHPRSSNVEPVIDQDQNTPSTVVKHAIASHPSSLIVQPQGRRCTKEEIERKRQEALKRQQASRLKRLIQSSHPSEI